MAEACVVFDKKGYVKCKVCYEGIRSGKACENCEGTGIKACPACRGTGWIQPLK